MVLIQNYWNELGLNKLKSLYTKYYENSKIFKTCNKKITIYWKDNSCNIEKITRDNTT